MSKIWMKDQYDEKAEELLPALNIIFDGPPSHESGRFVEVELDSGRSINAGEWIERPDGLWALRIDFTAVMARVLHRKANKDYPVNELVLLNRLANMIGNEGPLFKEIAAALREQGERITYWRDKHDKLADRFDAHDALVTEQAERIKVLEEALDYAERVCRDSTIKPYFLEGSLFRADAIPFLMRFHLADAIKERRAKLEGK